MRCSRDSQDRHDDHGRLSPADHPVFFAFGHYHKFLTAAEASTATPEERIQSIWPFVVKQVCRFMESLHPREAANFDADDVLIEIWIELRQKDAKWDHRIGTYISFAGKIIHHLFVRIRERSRTVESPRNTTCRLREYQGLHREGKLSPTRTKNWHDINRTISGTTPCGEVTPEYPVYQGPQGACLDRERQRIFEDAARRSVAQLGPLASAVLGRLYGLWDHPEETVSQVARSLRRSPEHVRRVRDSALATVRQYLEAEFHPSEREISAASG